MLKGIDEDIEISLKEYGKAWEEDEEGTTFIFGLKNKGEVFTQFGEYCLDKNESAQDLLSWLDKKDWVSLSNYIGRDEVNFSSIDTVWAAYDYFGYQNVFGEDYTEGLTYDEIIKKYK